MLFPAGEGSGGLPAEGELLGGELLPHGFFDFQHFFHGQFGGVQVAGNLSVEVASGFEPLIASPEVRRPGCWESDAMDWVVVVIEVLKECSDGSVLELSQTTSVAVSRCEGRKVWTQHSALNANALVGIEYENRCGWSLERQGLFRSGYFATESS